MAFIDRPKISLASLELPTDMNLEERLVSLHDQLQALQTAVTALQPAPTAPVQQPIVKSGVAPSGAGVQFSFGQVNQPGVSGYNVYRNPNGSSFSGAAPFRHIPHSPRLLDAIQVDDVLPAAQQSYYWVTAVDSYGNESQPTAAQAAPVSSGSVVDSSSVVVAGGIDFSRSYTNKNLDNVPNGTRAAWDSTTQKSAAVDSSGNLLLKNLQNGVGSTSSPSTTSTSYATVAEMTFTITTKGNKVLCVFSGSFNLSLAGNSVYFAIFRDGTQVSPDFVQVPQQNLFFEVVATYIDAPSAGSHTFDVRWKTAGGTLSGAGTNRVFQVVELG